MRSASHIHFYVFVDSDGWLGDAEELGPAVYVTGDFQGLVGRSRLEPLHDAFGPGRVSFTFFFFSQSPTDKYILFEKS